MKAEIVSGPPLSPPASNSTSLSPRSPLSPGLDSRLEALPPSELLNFFRFNLIPLCNRLENGDEAFNTAVFEAIASVENGSTPACEIACLEFRFGDIKNKFSSFSRTIPRASQNIFNRLHMHANSDYIMQEVQTTLDKRNLSIIKKEFLQSLDDEDLVVFLSQVDLKDCPTSNVRINLINNVNNGRLQKAAFRALQQLPTRPVNSSHEERQKRLFEFYLQAYPTAAPLKELQSLYFLAYSDKARNLIRGELIKNYRDENKGLKSLFLETALFYGKNGIPTNALKHLKAYIPAKDFIEYLKEIVSSKDLHPIIRAEACLYLCEDMEALGKNALAEIINDELNRTGFSRTLVQLLIAERDYKIENLKYILNKVDKRFLENIDLLLGSPNEQYATTGKYLELSSTIDAVSSEYIVKRQQFARILSFAKDNNNLGNLSKALLEHALRNDSSGKLRGDFNLFVDSSKTDTPMSLLKQALTLDPNATKKYPTLVLTLEEGLNTFKWNEYISKDIREQKRLENSSTVNIGDLKAKLDRKLDERLSYLLTRGAEFEIYEGLKVSFQEFEVDLKEKLLERLKSPNISFEIKLQCAELLIYLEGENCLTLLAFLRDKLATDSDSDSDLVKSLIKALSNSYTDAIISTLVQNKIFLEDKSFISTCIKNMDRDNFIYCLVGLRNLKIKHLEASPSIMDSEEEALSGINNLIIDFIQSSERSETLFPFLKDVYLKLNNATQKKDLAAILKERHLSCDVESVFQKDITNLNRKKAPVEVEDTSTSTLTIDPNKDRNEFIKYRISPWLISLEELAKMKPTNLVTTLKDIMENTEYHQRARNLAIVLLADKKLCGEEGVEVLTDAVREDVNNERPSLVLAELLTSERYCRYALNIVYEILSKVQIPYEILDFDDKELKSQLNIIKRTEKETNVVEPPTDASALYFVLNMDIGQLFYALSNKSDFLRANARVLLRGALKDDFQAVENRFEDRLTFDFSGRDRVHILAGMSKMGLPEEYNSAS